MSCTIGSINQIHRQLNENGYAISRRFLRRLVDDGQLPVMRSGNKVLLNYDSVVELLLIRTAIPDSAVATV